MPFWGSNNDEMIFVQFGPLGPFEFFVPNVLGKFYFFCPLTFFELEKGIVSFASSH